MTKEQVISIRKELHNLVNSDRECTIPLEIKIDQNNTFDEAMACFLWDDNNGILYIVAPNTMATNTLDSRLLPMSVMALDYEEIYWIKARVDRTCLNNFFTDKVAQGLTNEETQKRYFQQMTDLYDPRTYAMGQPSPTTDKIAPDTADVIDTNATKFL